MILMIETRIKSEYKKHNGSGLDFAKIAAIKIVSTLEKLTDKNNG